MPKVLRIINRFNIGGPTYNAALLTKYLAPEFETMLIGGREEGSEDSSSFILDELGVEGQYVGDMTRSVKFSQDKRAYKEIKNIIQEFRPDIVHTHASKAGALGRLAAHKMKVPVVVHTFHGHVFHSYFGKAKTAAYKAIERHLARKSDKIITISPIQQQEICKIHRICSLAKSVVIPLGFDLEKFTVQKPEKRKEFRDKLGIKDQHFVISIVGRLAPIKNHQHFLKSFALVAQQNPNARALIVGDGETRKELELLCQDLNLTSGSTAEHPVIFTSWIKQIDKVYAASDLVALSSLNEGTPVTLIEAQASGKPVVSTEVGGVADIVRHNETGLLSPKKDIQALATNMLILMQDSELGLKMGASGESWVLSAFSYRRLIKDMSRLYEQLLNSKGIDRI